MNKYFKILLGFVLFIIPICILIKQGILVPFVIFGFSVTGIIIGTYLVYMGFSELKEKKKNE